MAQLNRDLLATEALELQKTIVGLSADLDKIKAQLRDVANGEKLKITIPGRGEVLITSPRKGGEKTGTKIVLDEDRLNSVPELKSKLLAKGVIVENDVISTSAAASVTIKPNV